MLAAVEQGSDSQASDSSPLPRMREQLVAEPQAGDGHAREAPRGDGVERLVHEPELVLEGRARPARVEFAKDLVIHSLTVRPTSKMERGSAAQTDSRPSQIVWAWSSLASP